MNDNSFLQARRALLLDHCFFGSLVMHLDPRPDADAKRALWVDGKTVGYNLDSINGMGLPAAAGLLAKGVMHCALGHHIRRGDRNAELWQEAADLVTNPIILKSGLSLPPGAKTDPAYDGLSVEEAYRKLEQERQDQQEQSGGHGPGDQGGNQAPGTAPARQQGKKAPGHGPAQAPQTGEVRDMPGDAPGQAPGDASKTAEAEDWKVRLQQAVNSAQARGDLPAGIARAAEQALEPRVSWREELRRFFQSVARDDLSWNRPNRRFVWQGLYLPAIHSERLGPVVIAVDSSGSITQQLLDVFGSEINACLEDARPERVHLLACDAAITHTEEITADDLPLSLRAPGGGGTDFRPVFDWVEAAGITPACLIYLTDTEGRFPATAPGYPTLWASIKKGAGVPFGDLLYIDPTQRKGDLRV